MGFHHRITTPEDAQANGFAEAFVKVIVKLVGITIWGLRDGQVLQGYGFPPKQPSAGARMKGP